jgi:hypothetical protein
MRSGTLSIVVVLALFSFALVAGCGGGDNGHQPPGNTGTVSGELYGAIGGQFLPLGNQTMKIGSRTAQTQVGTGGFAITEAPAGDFTIEVQADPEFGQVLNPEKLSGHLAAGGSVDVGRILLGQKPPPP